MSQLTEDGRTDWQAGFVALLPQIERLLQQIYQHLEAERREESIQCATVYCLLSYVSIHARGRTDVVTASHSCGTRHYSCEAVELLAAN